MFRGLWEAKTRIILLKIEIFYNKSGVKFALSHKNSEKVFLVTRILEKAVKHGSKVFGHNNL